MTTEVKDEGPVTHLLIVRACGPLDEGGMAQFKIGYRGEPTQENIDFWTEKAISVFTNSFDGGLAPERVASAVLPWDESEDGDDSIDQDDPRQ